MYESKPPRRRQKPISNEEYRKMLEESLRKDKIIQTPPPKKVKTPRPSAGKGKTGPKHPDGSGTEDHDQ